MCWEITLRGCLHVKCLLLFTRLGWNEISSQGQGWNFIPGWEKEKMTCKYFIPGWNFKMSIFLFNFWRIFSNMLSKVNVFEHNESMKRMRTTSKKSKDDLVNYFVSFLLFFRYWKIKKSLQWGVRQKFKLFKLLATSIALFSTSDIMKK